MQIDKLNKLAKRKRNNNSDTNKNFQKLKEFFYNRVLILNSKTNSEKEVISNDN
jgi:hypothetical protein